MFSMQLKKRLSLHEKAPAVLEETFEGEEEKDKEAEFLGLSLCCLLLNINLFLLT